MLFVIIAKVDKGREENDKDVVTNDGNEDVVTNDGNEDVVTNEDDEDVVTNDGKMLSVCSVQQLFDTPTSSLALKLYLLLDQVSV